MCKLSSKAMEDILQQGRIYEVGGAIRDRFLKIDHLTKDRDYLVTGIPYDRLTQILKNHGRVDLVGRSFGVIKFTEFRDGEAFTCDVTLPRREHSTGGGHRDFEVDFDPNLSVEEDLVRRDFTINAMALALDSEELVDPLGGLSDLQNRCLRMTSEDSFEEDPLRMLRAVQFAARFKFSIEEETFSAICRYASLISTVSMERIAEELTKLLTLAEKPSVGFRLMQRSGLLEGLLPELAACIGVEQPGGYHEYDVFEHTLYCIDAAAPRLRLRLALLFHDITKPQAKRLTETGATFYGHEVSGSRAARSIMSRLRFGKELTSVVAALVERHMFTADVTDKGLRRLIRRVGTDLIFDLLDLRRADVCGQGMGGTTSDVDALESRIREELLRKPPFGTADLAIDGWDVMRLLKLGPSPLVGEILDYLLEQVLDYPEHNTREKLESMAETYYQSLNEDSDS